MIVFSSILKESERRKPVTLFCVYEAYYTPAGIS